VNGVLDNIPMTCDSELTTILLGHLHSIDVHYWPGIDGMTLDVVLSCYAGAAAAGEVPGKEVLLREHPELATELDIFFAGGPTSAANMPSAPSSCPSGIRAD
jgi:hypothetical protein